MASSQPVPSITCHILETPEAFQQVADLEVAVWGVDARDIVPPALMRAHQANGGIVLGALHETGSSSRMVGMALAFPGQRGGERYLWSHMAGVDPAFQGGNIGFKLKQMQRRWALEQGWRQIRWSFDPLQRGNANFNLHRLGATASEYHVNFYGIMNDAINVNVPSDRLEAVWDLEDARVVRLASGEPPLSTPFYPAQREQTALMIGAAGEPVLQSVDAGDAIFLQIPPRITEMNHTKPELANAWRSAMRESFQTWFERGYIAVNFVDTTAANGFRNGAYCLIPNR